jgi:hypothetical protein
MLTEPATVDAAPALPLTAPSAVMWTISQVAERDAVSKQAVSKKVRALAEKHGLTVERNSRGHITRLNVAEYDHLRGRLDDPSKAQRPPPIAPAEAPRGETYEEALRQKTWTEAERSRLNLAEQKRDLVRVAAIGQAAQQCAESIVAIIDRLPTAADDLAEAVARDGVHGLRVSLKGIAQRMRSDVAAALEALGGSEVTPAQGEAAPPLQSDDGRSS